jgi:hypothetical protein
LHRLGTGNREDVGVKANWSVAVVYEDAATRAEAVSFCDRLMERFWAECEFDVGWWSFDHLKEGDSAKEASQKAVEANLVVFAVRPEGGISPGFDAWIETWLTHRGDREGTLVGLLTSGNELLDDAAGKHVYLRNVAHRAGMDYLTEVPQSISHFIPDSLESVSERAQRVSSVLDEILRHAPPPPQLQL